MSEFTRKQTGSYFTPNAVVSTLVRWAIRDAEDRLLDPSCGDGRFIAEHRNSVGVEREPASAAEAAKRAPQGFVQEGDFFEWAAATSDRFDCATGNPPFIRYQSFNGHVRRRALRLCADQGATFSGLTSSWAPFLVATASLLKPSGRMAFVVPAEIGHAPYAAPLVSYLASHFDSVRIIAIREKLFPRLSEDCWLLLADGFGGSTDKLRFSALDRFEPSDQPPSHAVSVPLRDWREAWNCRLRPFLLTKSVRSAYQQVVSHADSKRFGDLATTRIGYVSGANEFFHLRPSEARAWGIPRSLLIPTVRNGRALPARELTNQAVRGWMVSDQPVMLLRIPRDSNVSDSLRRYLDTDSGKRARDAYKCRTRNPWYSVPDVRVPDLFLTYLSGIRPSLVRNSASATCTNTLHSIRVHDKALIDPILAAWETPFVGLSCEIEGHPLGGGLLKLEPREASRVVIPDKAAIADIPNSAISEALSTMRSWRHCDAHE